MAELERTSCFDESFHVSSRFCSLKLLGSGSTGLTVSALDTECDKSVAIKKVLLNNMKDWKSAVREVRILRQLEHDNIVRIFDVFLPTSEDTDMKLREQVYIVQELCDVDMKQVINSECMQPEHVKLFTYQLLRGLKYLHSANVVHRDLKPSNLLINLEDLTLKIGDFGLARIIDPHYCHKGHLTDNITTRCYRSPELMLHPQEYCKAIDMWAAGCVLAEMLTGRILFAGEHDLELMGLILDSIPLTESDINDIICTLPSKLLKNYNGVAKRPLCELVPTNDKQVLHLLQRLLAFSPYSRFSAKEALAHPYLKVFSDPQDEKLSEKLFRIEDEVISLSPMTLRKVILTENISKNSKELTSDEHDVDSAFQLKLQKSSNARLLKSEVDMQERFSDFEKDIDELCRDEFEEDEDVMSEKEDLSEKSESSNKECDELAKTDDEMEWSNDQEIETKIENGDNLAEPMKIQCEVQKHDDEKGDIEINTEVRVPEEIIEKNYQTDEERKAARLKLFENRRMEKPETGLQSQTHIIYNNNSDSDSDRSNNEEGKYSKNECLYVKEKSNKEKEENNQLIEKHIQEVRSGQIVDMTGTYHTELLTENKREVSLEGNRVENRSRKWVLENSMKNKGNEQIVGEQTEKAFVVDLKNNKQRTGEESVRQKHKSNWSNTNGGSVVNREKTLDACLSPRIEQIRIQNAPPRSSDNCCLSGSGADIHPKDCNCTALSKVNRKLNERLKQKYATRHTTLFDSTCYRSDVSQPLHIEIPMQPFLCTSPSRISKNTSPKDRSVRPKRKRSSPNHRSKNH
ncbi:mitogen-activated protein kinase 4-like [Anneissia japonica]|uniref:mitogen-activated protein kinase 4-like n=1 Tax=Anneissia japonica TaxID=1529436 RepID=UPI00142580E4|nr:mitogen-activated protein kinase 4-like [Anneissia japonica]XP_033109407.1 mitogen-activated protein kinase 4-like [Anneissia japonica]